MEYKQIEAFLTIAEFKNITKAADSLFVSQSALSYRLKTLEDELDTVLVVRSKGISNITLTEKGQNFLSIALEWRQVYNKTMAFSAASEACLIKIAAPTSINNFLSPIYNEIAAKDDNVRLSVGTYSSDEIPTLVARKEIDIGVGYISGESDVISAQLIDTFSMVIVEHTSQPRTEKEVTPSMLDPAKAILLRGISLDNPACGPFYKKWFGENMRYYMYADSPSTLINALPLGGWCIIPKSNMETFSHVRDYYFYDINDGGFCLPLYLNIRKNAAKELKSFANTYFKCQL